MIGLCGAELVRPESVGASQGFLGELPLHLAVAFVHCFPSMLFLLEAPARQSASVRQSAASRCAVRLLASWCSLRASRFVPAHVQAGRRTWALPTPASCFIPSPRFRPTFPPLIFAGWVAYLGAANAGIPLSIIVKDYGWGAYFTGALTPSIRPALFSCSSGCER